MQIVSVCGNSIRQVSFVDSKSSEANREHIVLFCLNSSIFSREDLLSVDQCSFQVFVISYNTFLSWISMNKFASENSAAIQE